MVLIKNGRREPSSVFFFSQNLEMSPSRRVAVLGAGYFGKVLAQTLVRNGYEVVTTRRSPDPDSSGSIVFDLQKQKTWATVPESWGYVLTFPAEPMELIIQFFSSVVPPASRLVAISTTSVFAADEEDATVDEDSRLNVSSPRVQGEKYLLQRGCIVLHSAGIYGPGRNPLDWVRNGLIANGRKFVNLIHVEDLANASIAALESSVSGRRYVASDGTPRRWDDIVSWAVARGSLKTSLPKGPSTGGSRRVFPLRLLREVSPHFMHTDFLAELTLLEDTGGNATV